MSFLRFWWTALSESFGFGWIAFGVVSTIMPAVISLIQRHWSYAASLTWVKWIVEYQAELQVAIAILFVVVYLVYSPFQLYEARDAARAEEVATRDTELQTREEEIRKRDDKINALAANNQRLEQNNQLAALLKLQIDATKKGSLSNRATQLATDIQNLVQAFYSESSLSAMAPLPRGPGITEEQRKAALDEQTQKALALFQNLSATFMRRDAPRVLTVAEELRANGLTDEKLDQWLRNPHATNSFVLTEVALSLSQLAIKMEEKERAPH